MSRPKRLVSPLAGAKTSQPSAESRACRRRPTKPVAPSMVARTVTWASEASHRMVQLGVLVPQILGRDVTDNGVGGIVEDLRVLHRHHVEAMRRALQVDGV